MGIGDLAASMAAGVAGSMVGNLLGSDTRFELRIGTFVMRELEVLSFRGVERMNAPFEYDVTFATSIPEGILQAEAFGFQACFTMHVPQHDPRVIQGIVVNLEAIGFAGTAAGSDRTAYRVRIAPRLWLLQHSTTYRVFENQSPVQIAQAVLAAANVPVLLRLEAKDYPTIPFIYQRGETDFAFLNRILANAGIFYYFEHSSGLLASLVPVAIPNIGGVNIAGPPTIMVLCDAAKHTEAMTDGVASAVGAGLASIASGGSVVGAASTFAGGLTANLQASVSFDKDGIKEPEISGVGYKDGDTLPYDPNGHNKEAERVFAFKMRKELRPQTVNVQDWDIKAHAGVTWTAACPTVISAPQVQLDAQGLHVVEGFDQDTLAFRSETLGVTEYQLDGGALTTKPTDYYAKRALAQVRADWLTTAGKSDCARLAPGYRFSLAAHPVEALNIEYLVTEVRAEGYNLDHLPTPETEPYVNEFFCVPSSIDPRPAKPKHNPSYGPEAAVVIGPTYNEINTDSIGRIQITFRWANGGSSGTCWAYWLERWGGNGYGTVTVPRVGSEVWVEFPQHMGGAPVAIGQLYSDKNAPPWPLPAEASKIGIRSNALPPLGEGYSEISIEDRAGDELVHIRAQRDMTRDVLRNSTTEIGGDESVHVAKNVTEKTDINVTRTIGGDEDVTVHGDRTSQVDGTRTSTIQGNDVLTVVGDQTHAVSGQVNRTIEGRQDSWYGDNFIERHAGHRTVVIGENGVNKSYAMHVNGPSRTFATKPIDIISREKITLTVGTSSITIDKDTISIVADNFIFKGKTSTTTTSDANKVTAKTLTVTTSDALGITGKDVTVTGTSSGTFGSPKTTLAGQMANLVLDSNFTAQGTKLSLAMGGSGGAPPAQDKADEKKKKVSTITLTDSDGKALANQTVILRKGGEGGEEQMVVLDDKGSITIEGEDSFDVFFPDTTDAKSG